MKPYKIISKIPLIGFTNDPSTIYKMIEMDGEIERKTNLYGYCVAMICGKKGLNWLIANKHLGFIEVYWSHVNWDSPRNVEMIAGVIKKRSGRSVEDIMGRAYIVMDKVINDEFLQSIIIKSTELQGHNFVFEMISLSGEVDIEKIEQKKLLTINK